MPDKFNQTQHIEQVQGDANYHYHHHYPAPLAQQAKANPKRWGWAGGLVAALALGGTLVTTQLNARTVYYCASQDAEKYHTDATCRWLNQCHGRVKKMPLGQAKARLQPCKACH